MVVTQDSRSASICIDDYADRRSRKQLANLVVEAQRELAAAAVGDLAAIYSAHRLTTRAVVLMLRHRWDA